MILLDYETWGIIDQDIIRNLNLSLEVRYWGPDEYLFGNMSLLIEKEIPFLVYAWTVRYFISIQFHFNLFI